MAKLDTRRRKALARLSKKGRRAIANPVTAAVDDLIFGSMGKTLAKLSRASVMLGGDGPGSVELADGVRVTLEPTEAKGWFGDRLREIDSFAQSLADTHGLDLTDVRGRLLWVDGWRVNGRTTKTPPWMEPHREIESGEVMRLVDLAWFPEIVRWYEAKNAERTTAKVSNRRASQGSEGGGIRIGDAVVV